MACSSTSMSCEDGVFSFSFWMALSASDANCSSAFGSSWSRLCFFLEYSSATFFLNSFDKVAIFGFSL